MPRHQPQQLNEQEDDVAQPHHLDGDNACCHHHLDDVAVPRCLPARSAAGAGDMALPCYRHLMVRAVLDVGG